MDKIVFSEQEKLFLVQLVTNEKDILENKKTDGSTLKLKNEAWEKITSIFNSQGFSKRSSKQLRKCWENIKQRKRKLNTTIKQQQLMTGGGPPIKIKYDPIMDFVGGAAPNLDVEINCFWDSTAMYQQKCSTNTSVSTPSINKEVVVSSEAASTSYVPVHEQKYSSKIDIDISTPSTNVTQVPTLTIKKRKLIALDIDSCDECELRAKKIKESVLQQRELHKQRMQTTKMEYLLAVLKVKQQLNEMGEELNLDEIDFENFEPKDLL